MAALTPGKPEVRPSRNLAVSDAIMLVRKNPDEAKRLNIVSHYDALDSASDAAFDRITRLAQAALRAPVAMMSLITENRQWIKSSQGSDIREIPRSSSICAHVIEANEPLIVPDLRADPRFADRQLVVEGGLRFYAGVPLTTSGGYRIGTLCAADREPREATTPEIAHLQDLARLSIELFEFRKSALTDSLTGLCTRRAFLAEATRQAASAKRNSRSLACAIFDVDHFKLINTNYGNAAGDLVLQAIADVCRREGRKLDVASRIGSEEFAVLMPETGIEGAMRAAERLRAAMAEANVLYAGNHIKFTVSLGISVIASDEIDAIAMVDRAESALQEAKRSGRNQTAVLAPAGDMPPEQQRARIAVRR